MPIKGKRPIVTVFVNGIPSTSQPLNLNYASSASLSAPTVTYNANGIVTATITSTAAIPAGVVTLSVDGGLATSANLVSVYSSSPLRATATFTLTTPIAGDHTLSANYVAQNNFAASSASGTLHVDQAATTTTVASSKNPSTFGQTAIFTATVSSGSGTLTGTVTFKDGTTILGTATITGTAATFSTATLAAGSHTITAVHNGDTNLATSTGTLAASQVVTASNVLVLLASSPSPMSAKQIATFTATVGLIGVSAMARRAAPACALTGTVTFRDGASTLSSSGLDDNCQAVYTTTARAVGAHSIKAEYSGDANYSSGTSNLATMVVHSLKQYLPLISSSLSENPQKPVFSADLTPFAARFCRKRVAEASFPTIC